MSQMSVRRKCPLFGVSVIRGSTVVLQSQTVTRWIATFFFFFSAWSIQKKQNKKKN